VEIERVLPGDSAETIAAKHERNRQLIPAVSEITRQFRAVFGAVSVLGGKDFTTGVSFGLVQTPSPNCSSCTGHTGRHYGECDRMDYIAPGDDKPDPARMFCGYRLAGAPVVITDRKGKPWKR
jgi:hypothetical protein